MSSLIPKQIHFKKPEHSKIGLLRLIITFGTSYRFIKIARCSSCILRRKHIRDNT